MGPDGGNAFEIATDAALPAVTSDGKTVITLNPPSNFTYSVTRFTTDGRAVAYVDASGRNIWAQPLDGSAPRQITHFAGDRLIESFAWSRDGKRLAMIWGTRTNDIVLLRSTKH